MGAGGVAAVSSAAAHDARLEQRLRDALGAIATETTFTFSA